MHCRWLSLAGTAPACASMARNASERSVSKPRPVVLALPHLHAPHHSCSRPLLLASYYWRDILPLTLLNVVLPVLRAPPPPPAQCCFFAHSAGQLRARTTIKTYSGGRRSGKRHRAAQALQAAATGEGGAWGTDASPANSLCFLQVPSLPFADVASTTSGSSNGLLQLDAAAQEAFSCLSLEASTQPVGTRPVAVQHVQPQPPSMLFLQDHESACSSAEPLPALGYGMPMMAAGGAPLGMCGPPVCSSMASTLAGCPGTSSIPGANMQGVSVLQLASAPQALPGILLADSMQGTWVHLQQQQQQVSFIPCLPPVGAATPTGPGLAMLPAGAAVSAGQYILLPANQVAGGISTATVQALQAQP